MRKREEIGRFHAKSDDGEEYIVLVNQNYIWANNLDGSGGWISDIVDYTLADGTTRVTPGAGDQELKIVWTNKIIRKIV